jgi:MFS family permease
VLAERSYWLLFTADAATCLVFATIIARAVPETRPPSTSGERGSYLRVLRDGTAVGLFLSVLLASIVYMQQLVTLPLAVRASGLSASAFGLIYAVNPVVVIVAQPLVLRLVDRFRPVPTLAVSSLVMGVGFALTGFARTVPAFALTVLVWTVGEIGFNAVGPALVAEIAPPELRGRYSGLIGMAFGGAALLGPLAGTWLFGLRPGLLWFACLVAGALAGALVLALGPAISRRRLATAPAEGRVDAIAVPDS